MAENKRRRLNATSAREMLGRFAQSNLSVQGFCEREGMSAVSFYRWRSLLSESEAGNAVKRVAQRDRPRADFIELGALESGGARVEVRLDLGGGVLLSVVRG